MCWKLKINEKIDEKLLPNFPDDPFYDITIQTASQELHLTLAYLAIDSGYFSQIDPSTKCVHLKHLSEAPLIAVLKGLYGGELTATSTQELDDLLRIIQYLDIQEFKDNIEKGLIALHLCDPDNSPFNSIDMIEFCLKNNVLKEYICDVHYRSNLRTLETSKNYLQLSKLSKDHLNHLLLNYLTLEGPQAAKTINTILENYFNRKSIRPADYFEEERLEPLRKVWEEFHHKISTIKASRPLTRTYPNTSTRISSYLRETTSPEHHSESARLQRLSSIPIFDFQNINMSLSMLKQDNVSQDSLLDARIQMLEREDEERSAKIENLKRQMKLLQEQLDQRKKLQLGELGDITLFQNVARTRYAKQSLLNVDTSFNRNQNAFLLQRPTSREQSKSACKYSPTFPLKAQAV